MVRLLYKKRKKRMNYIKYNTESIPVKCSYRVIKNIKSQLGIDLTNAALADWYSDFSNQEKLFYEMIKEGYRQEKKECPYMIEDIEDILTGEGIYAELLNIYTKDVISFMTPLSKKKELEEQEKQNQIQTV